MQFLRCFFTSCELKIYSKYISFIGKFFESFELQHLYVTIENLANNIECFNLKFDKSEIYIVIEILQNSKLSWTKLYIGPV